MLHNGPQRPQDPDAPLRSCRVGAKGPAPPPVPLPRTGTDRPDPTSCRARHGPAQRQAAGRRGGGDRVSSMVTARSPKTHYLMGNGSAPRDAPRPRAAVFVDLDRTLLRGRQRSRAERGHACRGALRGPALAARRAHPLRALRPHGREPRLHGDGACRPALHPGMGGRGSVPRRELAAPELAELVQPYARGVLAEHREAGHLLVLTTTTPSDLVAPFAALLGFDHVLATRYGARRAATPGASTATSCGRRASSPPSGVGRRRTKVDLSQSHAYSDSVFDLPLLGAVGHPHAVNPDRRLRAVARLAAGPSSAGTGRRGCPRWAASSPTTCCGRWCAPPVPLRALRHLRCGPRARRGPVILAANHRSYFDVVALAIVAARLGPPRAVPGQARAVRRAGRRATGPGPRRDPRRPGEPLRHAPARGPAASKRARWWSSCPRARSRGQRFFDTELRGRPARPGWRP